MSIKGLSGMKTDLPPPTRDPLLQDAVDVTSDFLRKNLHLPKDQCDAIGGALADYLALHWGGQLISFTVNANVEVPTEAHPPTAPDANTELGAGARRVQLLQEIMTVAKGQLQTLGAPELEAEKAGQSVASLIADYWGGSCIYIPKSLAFKRHFRDKEIFRRLCRGNANQLAQEYGISVVRIYQIYNRCSKERRRINQAL